MPTLTGCLGIGPVDEWDWDWIARQARITGCYRLFHARRQDEAAITREAQRRRLTVRWQSETIVDLES